MISYIVSVLDRTWFLNACLASLALQQDTTDITICCNGLGPATLEESKELGLRYAAKVVETGAMGAANCYQSANMAVVRTSGEWLCFPSDDSLYVMEFARIMLETAHRAAADLVYCDCVYRQDADKGNWPAYKVLDVSPKMGRIDKTCFIVRRSLFTGFPAHERGWEDGAFIEQLMKAGVRHAKAPGVLVVHQ